MSELFQNTASHLPGSYSGTLTIEHWLAGGEILPTQLAPMSIWTPEKRLAAAVLRDALLNVRNACGAAKGRQHTVNEDLRWIQSDDQTWPYSFVPLCHVFGLDVAWVRRMVRTWQQEPCAERARYATRFRNAA